MCCLFLLGVVAREMYYAVNPDKRPRKRSRRPFICLSTAMSLTLGALLTGCVHQPYDSAREALLSLPYKEFDQTPGGGWRTLEGDKRHREAVVLIEHYLKRHRELPPKESAMLHFHAAQLLATEGENRLAVVHLKQARCDGQVPGYNEFADAMRAFLQRDRDELLAIRDRVRQYPPEGMTVAYQSVVESFVERFHASYNDVMAYEMAKKKK